MKLYVGNLPWSSTDSFAFVEMDNDSAKKAMEELNGREVGGRALKVNEANEKPKRSSNW